MEVIEFNKKNTNPFYGLKACLKVYQDNEILDYILLNKAYEEVKNDPEKLKMFYSLCFSIGDITNREHNIFKHKKKDSGGFSQRESFFTFVNWLWNNHREQFIKFLNEGLFNEYNCFDTLLRNRIQSTRQGKVLRVYSMLEDANYRQILAEYFYKIINGTNPFNKSLIAKFLTVPRLGKRSKHQKMLSETFGVMKAKAEFLKILSDMMGWSYQYKGNYANFSDFRKWKQEYNGEFESVLFSTGKISEFDREQFLSWLDKLPAGARFRVKNRVIYPELDGEYKWPNLKKWFEEWESYKEKKQEEQRDLEEKVRQGDASQDDLIKLEKVKKEAKVNVGATSFKQLYQDIQRGNVDKLKLEAFANKVNLPYNALVIVDDSGSMSGAPFNFGTFLASICLCKNPTDEGRNLFGLFGSEAYLYSAIDAKSNGNTPNSLWYHRQNVTKISPEPFVDPHLSFYENYQRISNYMNAMYHSGCTYINRIPEYFKKCCDKDPQIKDALKAYPVWVIVSDGEWNSLYSPEASMNDFMRKCEDYFGYRPFIIAIDVMSGRIRYDQFGGIDNMVYIPGAPEMIEQMLLNFKDMDRFDVYMPLESIYRSNRYELIRNTVIC